MSDDREQKIRDRAYALWEAGGGEHGRHEEHWAHAEQDVGREASGSDDDAVNAPTQPEPAEGDEDTAERLPGSPEG